MIYCMNCPLINQYQDMNNAPQTAGLMAQQYPQQLMPMQQLMQTPQYFPMQVPVEYEDNDNSDIGPATLSPDDPPPILSNNPAVTTIVSFKELTAYPNYGNPSRNADILYKGNRGSWTFQLPAFLLVPGNLRAQAVIRSVLDDHSSVPVNRYSARITINGNVVHDGRLNLEHGTPAGGIFTNWRDLNFNIPNLRRTNRITIENTSTGDANDWIAFDWMEIRLVPR